MTLEMFNMSGESDMFSALSLTPGGIQQCVSTPQPASGSPSTDDLEYRFRVCAVLRRRFPVDGVHLRAHV